MANDRGDQFEVSLRYNVDQNAITNRNVLLNLHVLLIHDYVVIHLYDKDGKRRDAHNDEPYDPDATYVEAGGALEIDVSSIPTGEYIKGSEE